MPDENEKDREKETVREEENTGEREAGIGGEEVGAETKNRSETELDAEDIDIEGIPQEGEAEKEVVGKQEGEFKRGDIGKKRYIIIGFSSLLCLILIAGGVFIWARYFASDDGKEADLSAIQGPVYELKPFFIPLNSKAESKNFMRLTMVLELCDESDNKQILKQIEQIRSNVFKILINVSPAKIQWERRVLAEEILSTINLLIEKEIVKRVFFKDVLVI